LSIFMAIGNKDFYHTMLSGVFSHDSEKGHQGKKTTSMERIFLIVNIQQLYPFHWLL
jgi:hypothetical protein